MTFHFNENQAKEEYSKVIKTLKQDGLGSWSGEWEDKTSTNKFGRTVTVKGDRHKYTQYYNEQQKIIKDGLDLRIDDEYDDNYDI